MGYIKEVQERLTTLGADISNIEDDITALTQQYNEAVAPLAKFAAVYKDEEEHLKAILEIYAKAVVAAPVDKPVETVDKPKVQRRVRADYATYADDRLTAREILEEMCCFTNTTNRLTEDEIRTLLGHGSPAHIGRIMLALLRTKDVVRAKVLNPNTKRCKYWYQLNKFSREG